MDGKEGVVRYSDSDLDEFKAVIEKKLGLAKEQLESLQEQILEISENLSDEHGGDWVDDSSTNSDVEMLNNMAIRQRKYIQDLENALVRIRNKTYGICIITGDLIDKRRLLAVPTTTKSLTAKTDERKREEARMITGPSKTPYVKESQDEDDDEEDKPKKPRKPKIITKVIRKSSAPPPVIPSTDDDEEDDDRFMDDIDLPDLDDDDVDVDTDVDDDDVDVDFDDIPADEEDDD